MIEKFEKFNENDGTKNYMFFNNLNTIKRLVDGMLEMDESTIDSILTEHDWASDHISVANENIEHVFNFLSSQDSDDIDDKPL
jgi:hypothetical protein